MPVEKAVGDIVYAGTLNALGAMNIRVTRVAADTALAHIIHLVEAAQGRRAPLQSFVDKFARVYTPAVLVMALILAIAPPLLWHAVWHAWIYRALALIVVACPCALVISTPVAIVSAIGNAARHGVLIKGGVYLEQMARLSVIAFDKTGTLTQGRPEVSDVLPIAAGIDSRTLLTLAAAVEESASHILAEAIVRQARALALNIPPATAAMSLSGRGARAQVDGRTIFVGNRRYLNENGIDLTAMEHVITELEMAGKSVMLVGRDGELLGVLAAVDNVRPESQNMIRCIRQLAVEHVALLTGDHRETAVRIAEELGINEVRAELLPEEKAQTVQTLIARFGSVCMVGDGINDAPALATATVGIAMGVAGSDAALETADITLMADDISKIPYTIRLSRQTLRIIRQNIIIALAIKALAIALVFPGLLTLWLAVLADMGASIIVTLNGMRLIQHEREKISTEMPCDCLHHSDKQACPADQ
jgi:Cd2+/Zn2+-exporting ATPase